MFIADGLIAGATYNWESGGTLQLSGGNTWYSASFYAPYTGYQDLDVVQCEITLNGEVAYFTKHVTIK